MSKRQLRKAFPALVMDRSPGVGYEFRRWLKAAPVIPAGNWLAQAFAAAPGPALSGKRASVIFV